MSKIDPDCERVSMMSSAGSFCGPCIVDRGAGADTEARVGMCLSTGPEEGTFPGKFNLGIPDSTGLSFALLGPAGNPVGSIHFTTS